MAKTTKKKDTVKQDLQRIPVVPLRGLIIFPSMIVHFDVGREKSLAAMEQAMENDQLIFLTCQTDPETDNPTSMKEMYNVGTVCKIKQMAKLPGNSIRVLVEGMCRGELVNFYDDGAYFEGDIAKYEVEPQEEPSLEIQALMRTVLDSFEEYIHISTRLSPEMIMPLNDITDPDRLADIIASNLLIKSAEKQSLLEIFDAEERLNSILEILKMEIQILKIEQKLNQRVRRQMTKSEKDYYLREQLKAIHRELGDIEGLESDVQKYTNQLKKLKVSKEIKEKITKEINRLSKMSRQSIDADTIRQYLDVIFSLPWNKADKENIDIDIAKKILDEDHYGLEKVKDRILDFLAVKKLSKSMKGPILCLVGPPGVGKTSICKSIARALDKKFARISLGGVRDEAEIRGHRRTYVGAIPGRVLNAYIETKTNNPVILFDEIDKMASDYKGDPASAMLEVLDPEQNKNFTDHYLEMPFDLSKTLFITTANSLSGIPAPLIDRMEIINLSGYTLQEKQKIASKYILPKQLKEHSLDEKFITLSQNTLESIINYYTRESGVRQLERTIGTLCRKAARKKVSDMKLKSVRINETNLEKYLGKKQYSFDMANKEPEIGTVRGLAWTQVGGETLSVEVTVMQGKGKLQLTGQLGDVMKESASAAISYIRTISDKYNLEENFYENTDIHIHIPEGAIPKDGPSAGITMATAILSALTKIPVRCDLAMTGEITLRGKVLPVGGIKEKLLAAHRAGIDNIILPVENKKDLDEIPNEIKKQMTFTLAENMDIVLETAFIQDKKPKAKKSSAKKTSNKTTKK